MIRTRGVSRAGPRDTQRGRAVSSTRACFEGSQSGSSSISILGPTFHGMPGFALLRSRDGGEALLAVEREHVLAPVVGRRVLGGDVGRPVAHHLLGDAALNWQRAAC